MSNSMITIVPLILLIAVMYFLMIRPQRKREKETTAMRNSLQVGDEIVTIGGFCGRIVRTKDETIVIQVGPDKTKMEIMRWGVSKVVSEGKGHNKASADDYSEMGDAEEKEARKAKPKRMKKAAPVKEEEPAAEIPEKAPAAEETAAEAPAEPAPQAEAPEAAEVPEEAPAAEEAAE